ncbi:GGDEF domain-containing protein, partial [bacterium]|nr:GGDEF domain-containing protein [bacterium]
MVKTFQLERNVGYYREFSLHDDLTGLYNRRYFYEAIQKEINRAFRYNHCVSLLIVDIDNFKVINDSYGHLAGDMVLRQIAQLFIVSLRKVDYIFRYRGEKFAILLSETTKENAFSVAERLRTAIKSNNFVVKASDKVSLTVSIGLASCPHDAEDKKEIIHKADKALYQAK